MLLRGKVSFECIFHIILEGCILRLIYNLNSHLSLLFFSGRFLGGFRRYPHVLAMMSVAVINWGVFSSQGPPWSSARVWLLQSSFSCRSRQYLAATCINRHFLKHRQKRCLRIISGFFRNTISVSESQFPLTKIET